VKHARYLLLLLVPISTANLGCITTAAVLTAKVIGDSINDDQTKKQRSELIGEKLEAADRRFGERLETLIDTTEESRKVLVYNVKEDTSGNARYVVEAYKGNIVAFSKKMRHESTVDGVIKRAELGKKVIGKSPAECERAMDFGKPAFILRCPEKKQLVRIYDIPGSQSKKLSGATFCVLRFDSGDRCREINLIGAETSSGKGRIINVK
jgi:hypothetical protein